MLARILRARDDLAAGGIRPRLVAPVAYAALGRLKDRELSGALHHLDFRADEIEAVASLEERAQKVAAALAGRKTASSPEAYAFLEKAPGDLLAFLLAESSNSKVVGKIRTYLNKWKPLRQALPAAVLELESIGMPRGPKFDKAIEDLFQAQLAGKARNPELRIKLLRKLSGIKEPPKKKPDEKAKKPADKSKKKPGAPRGAAPRGGPPAGGAGGTAAAEALARPASGAARAKRHPLRPHNAPGKSRQAQSRRTQTLTSDSAARKRSVALGALSGGDAVRVRLVLSRLLSVTL